MYKSRSLRLSALIFCIFTSFSCGNSDDLETEPSSGAIEIGTGTTQFEIITPEQELNLIPGVQGGYHFIVHARFTGDLIHGDPDVPGKRSNPLTSFSIYKESGERIDAAPPPLRLGYKELEDGVYSLSSGRISQINFNRQDELLPDLYGERVRLVVRIEDVTGFSTGDDAWVVVKAQ